MLKKQNLFYTVSKNSDKTKMEDLRRVMSQDLTRLGMGLVDPGQFEVPSDPLSEGDHRIMDAMAEVYATRKDHGADDMKLPVLVSYGFDLVAGDPPTDTDRSNPCLADREGKMVELLMNPVMAEVVFDLEAKFITKLLREACKRYPDIDHRALWIGSGAELSPDGRMRIKVLYRYFVPDAANCAPDYINSPPLAVYPTKTYPTGFARKPGALWRRRSLRCASFCAPEMAVLLPFDELVGWDFGAPKISTKYWDPFSGNLDRLFPIGEGRLRKVEDQHHQICSYSWDGALAQIADRLDHYEYPEEIPAVMELLRLQRGSAVSVVRVPLGGIKRRNARTKKRNVNQRRARKGRAK